MPEFMVASVHRKALAALFAASLLVAAPAAGLAQQAAGAAAQAGLPPPGAPIEYTIRGGDTMIGISRRYLLQGDRLEVQRALWEYNRLANQNSIRPGQVIRIPGNWMRNEAGPTTLERVEGDVRSGTQALIPGSSLSPGDGVRTGKDGFATIRLADGSTLELKPDSEVVLESVRKSPLAEGSEAKFLLRSGRAEAAVQKRPAGGARFEVRTPIAVAAVRGTRFRVASDAARQTATSEVLEGVVEVADNANLGRVSVAEGFGTRVKSGEPPAEPRALLPAPRLWTGIRLSLRSPVTLNFTSLPGATGYRVLVARRADFAEVIYSEVVGSNQIPLPEMANGPYFLKVRGIDDLGLEGRDATADLVFSVDRSAPAPAPAPVPAPAPGSASATMKSP